MYEDLFRGVREASRELAALPSDIRSAAIKKIGELLRERWGSVLNANAEDISNNKDIPPAMLRRLALSPKQLESIAAQTLDIALSPDPLGVILEGVTRPNGLRINKVSVPIGVIGIIYESRPNVTIDCAALALRSGNACLLRGGNEAAKTNASLYEIIKTALKQVGIPPQAVTVIAEDKDRVFFNSMLKADKFIDLIIPRGGEGLIKAVTENTSIPVIKHDKGVCHIYIDKYADLEKALNIVLNAKTSNPSACNAAECVLIHEDRAYELLPLLIRVAQSNGVTLYGCERTLAVLDIPSVEEWGREYLSLELAVKIVENAKEAAEHIARYGSGHSEAIVTESCAEAELFTSLVDAACVYVNASTRFTDGGEFGFGAEVGISTGKLHARGPMGARHLTTHKYIVHGNGQLRN